MGKVAYNDAICFLRNLTKIDFFGWVDDDYNVDAIAYIPVIETGKLYGLKEVFSETIWQQLNFTFSAGSFLRVCIPCINSEPAAEELNHLQKKLKISAQFADHYTEQRLLKVVTVSMPTGSFATPPCRTILEQIGLFYQHVDAAYQLLTKHGDLLPDEIAICVMPEFYSFCSSEGRNNLFMSSNTQALLLAKYCKVSSEFPNLLIMVNITAMTPTEERDKIAIAMGHKARQQKINALFGLKGGEVVYISHKLNKGPADIPESELHNFEAERNTYHEKQVDRKVMPLDYLKMFKGITFAGSVCIDAYEGVLGKYLSKQFSGFQPDEYGPAIQIISSSSMALPITYKKRNQLDEMQIITPKISQGIIIQADGHNKIKRSGVWVVEGENFIRQEPADTVKLSSQVEIESYEICARVLHNKLNEKVGRDIDEVNIRHDDQYTVSL